MTTLHKTAKKIFDALAFANISNLGELQALLREVDEPSDPAPRPLAARPRESVCPPVVGHARGALQK